MKRLFLFAATMVCSVTIFAASVTVGGHACTSEGDIADLTSILDAREGVTATGTISWDATTATLTLSNATIEDSNSEAVLSISLSSDITLQLTGTNVLRSTYSGYQNCIALNSGNANSLTITGDGSLKAISQQWYPVSVPSSATLAIEDVSLDLSTEQATDKYYNYGINYNSGTGGTLTINNATVKAGQIGGMKSITLTDCKVVAPDGAEVVKIDETTYKVGIGENLAYGVVIAPAPKYGDTIEVDGVKYRISSMAAGSEKVYVVVQDYAAASLTIPASVSYYDIDFTVEYIINKAFKGNTTITSVDVACQQIWSNAFENCTNLETVTLREGVQQINQYAFSNIKATSIHLPASLYSLDANSGSPFSRNKFTEITIATGNTSFVVGEDGAIYNTAKTKLMAYPYNWAGGKFTTIPETVTTILDETFYNCQNIADTLVIPENLARANRAFSSSNVKCVVLNSESLYLSNVFQGTSAIKEVIIGKKCKKVGELMFWSCDNITKITVLAPTMPTLYNYRCFSTTVQTSAIVYIPCEQTATYQADADWANFSNFEEKLMYDVDLEGEHGVVTRTSGANCNEVTVSVSDVESGYTFVNWSNGSTETSTTFTITSDTTIRANIKKNLAVGDLFRANTVEGVSVLYKILTKEPGNMTVQVGDKNGFVGGGYAIDQSYNGPLTISETVNYFDEIYTVVALGHRAFDHCSITSLSLPNTVQKLDQNSIYECTKLKSVNIPEGLTIIPRYNFSYMNSLESITLPTTLEYICSGVFNMNTKMATIENWNPSQYKRVGNNVGTMNTKFFSDLGTDDGNIVYAGDILLRQNASAGIDTLFIKEGTRLVCGDLKGDETLTTIVLPASLEAIGDMSFYNMLSLTSCIIKAADPVEVYQARDTQDPTRTMTASQLKSGTTPEISTIKFYVPKASVSAYKESTTWAGMDIRPIGGWDVTFIDGDGNRIGEVQHIEEGQMPVLPEITPTKTPTTESVFSFNGTWLITGGTIVSTEQTTYSDMVYTAQFNESPRPYNIYFIDDDDTPIWNAELNYGSAITFGGTLPTTKQDAQYDYTFSGWSDDFEDGVTTVNGEMTFRAQYDKVLRKFHVYFYLTEADALAQTNRLGRSEEITYGGSAAEIATTIIENKIDARECEQIIGWNGGDILNITGELHVWPEWGVGKYTIVFFDPIAEQAIKTITDVECGDIITAPAAPEYDGYTFQGWDSEDYKNDTFTHDLQINAVYVSTPTGIDALGGKQQAVKLIEDGRLYICMPDGTRFDAQGKQVK